MIDKQNDKELKQKGKVEYKDLKHVNLNQNLQFLKDEQRDNDFDLQNVPSIITKVWGPISHKEY